MHGLHGAKQLIHGVVDMVRNTTLFSGTRTEIVCKEKRLAHG